MADTKIRIRKATTMLREDHRTVKRLFAEFDKLEESETPELSMMRLMSDRWRCLCSCAVSTRA